MAKGSSICLERRFGCLFERAFTTMDHRLGCRTVSWDLAGLSLAPALPRGVCLDPVVVASSSDKEESRVARR